MSLSGDDLTRIARENEASGIKYADGLAVLAYVRTLQGRAENLSTEYRIAANTAEQSATTLAQIRDLLADHDKGKLPTDQLVAGLKYWTTT